MIRRPALALAVSALLLGALAQARADDDPKAPPAPGAAAKDEDPVRVQWAAVKAAEADILKAREAKDRVKYTAAMAAKTTASDAFVKVFAAADWSAYDAVKDQDLLAAGLVAVAADNVGDGGDPKVAIKASRAFIDRCAASPMAKLVRGRFLPLALLRDHDLPGVIATWSQLTADEDHAMRGSALLALGDAYCAQGDLNAAQASWSKLAELPTSASPKDPVVEMKAQASARLALVGKDAPDIDSKTWLGGDAKPLSKMKGSVVVLLFWAAASPPCRVAMPPLSALAARHKDDGLVVLGVTRFNPQAWLPNEDAKDVAREGLDLPKGSVKPENFSEYLTVFRERMKVGWPFVTAAEADFNQYQISLLPTMVVLDREGKVALLQVGSETGLVEMTADRLLKAE